MSDANSKQPTFVGRLEEMDRLTTALTEVRDGHSITVLVTGEAGIGKSALINHFRNRTPDATFLVGGCLNLGDAPSHAPFVAILRSLVRRVGLDALRASLPPAAVSGLAWLLPEFDEPLPANEGTRARMFDAFLTLLEHLTSEGHPVALVVEDVHWADPSTWDLIAYVVNNAHEIPLLTLLTFRDLPYAHPLRGPISELGRHARVAQMKLEGLHRTDVGLQATAVLGHPPAAQLLDEIFRRSEGNPLFVEALLDPSGVNRPSSGIRDLLIAPIERLPPSTERILRAAAVGGSEVGHDVLGAVSGTSDEELDEALRPAVRERILLPTHDGYRFRHALIAEAIYESLLLPGERKRLHRRFAEAIEQEPSLAPPVLCHASGEVARHWAAAGMPVLALAATWRAAQEGRDVLAHPERLKMLRQVLELWCLVEQPSAVIGVTRAVVLRDIVEAADESGDIELGMSIASEALQVAKCEKDMNLAAQILERRARMRSRLGVTGAVADLEEALALLSGGPPTSLKSRLLAHLAYRLWAEGRPDTARSFASDALTLGKELNDDYSEALSIITLAGLLAEEGETQVARANFGRARDQAERIKVPMLVVASYMAEASVLEMLGDAAGAAGVARIGVRRAGEVGLARTLGVPLAGTLAEALFSLGEWNEALEVLTHSLELEPPKGYRAAILATQGEILVARGEFGSAARILDEIHDLSSDSWDTATNQFAQAAFEANFLIAQEDPQRALLAVLDALVSHPAQRAPRRAWPLLVTGARAHFQANLQGRLLPLPQMHAAQDNMERLKEAASATSVRTDVDRAWRASFVAEASPASQRREAREAELYAWERAGQPYPLAWALVRSTDGLIARRSRTEAVERLRRARAIGEALGAMPLVMAVHATASRAGLTLAEAPSRQMVIPKKPEFGLTAREVEVLRLVAEGLTNRQIANHLFISVKTVSVHISRILMKMDASTRGEAAAKAHRLHFFDENG
ncbi:AAA family ATPase [Micromonospora sp. NPDC047707]|uniref:helix-turn-helix transcriptional regulator n=1 Tax=Micromonospora sp. NPDC047707 TaxID=3154498 RepID=UPI003455F6D5